MTSTTVLAGIIFLLTGGSPVPMATALGMMMALLDVIIAVAFPMNTKQVPLFDHSLYLLASLRHF